MKKVLSIVLALAMVLTFMIPAYAEGTSVVYYVGDAQDGEAVTGLTAGEVYNPDRLPIAAAPEGKYFAGWKDASGNYVLTGTTLADGENKLYASYVDYPVEEEAYLGVEGLQTLDANTPIISGPKVHTTVADGEKYLPYYKSEINGGYIQREYVTEGEGAPYIKYGSNPSGTHMAVQMLYDENGVAFSGKYSTTYKIIVEFTVPASTGAAFAIVPGFGVRYNRLSNGVENYNVLTAVGNQCSVVPNRVTTRPTVDGTKLATGSWQYNFTINGATEYFMSTDPNTSANYIGEAGDTVHTAVYEISTGTATDNIAPYFTLTIKAGASTVAFANTVEIRSVKIIDSSLAKVEYIENGEVVDTISGLAAGSKYTIDRAATAAAPEGKYFAGWKTADGKFAVDAITLAGGNNTLTAVYKDRVSGTVEADLTIANLPVKNGTTSAQVLIPAVYDGVYQGYAARNGWAPTEYATDGIDSYIRHYNNVTWGQSTIQYIHDEEGSVFVARPETTYKITFSFRVPQNAAQASGEKPGFKMYVDVGWNPSIRNNSQSSNGNTSWEYKARPVNNSYSHDHGTCRAFWSDIDETAWTTETFTITTKTLAAYESAGLLPIFTYHVSHPASTTPTELHVRSITIEEIATSVNYYVEGELEKTVGSLKIGSTYNVDYTPVNVPEGKLFGGWKDAQGNIVTSLTLAETGNDLYAYFKEATTVAYYVNGVKEGDTITGFNEGDTYAPDRMPTAAAPAGKYFAGWQNEAGEYIVDGVVLTDGENKLTAVYKDYVTGTVSASIPQSTLPTTLGGAKKVLLPSVVDGVYQGHAKVNGYATVTDKTENGEPYLQYTSWGDWSNPTLQLMHDEDGVALQAKPETTYKIDFTYRIPSYSDDAAAYSFETWKAENAIDSEAAKAYRTNFGMYMNVGFDTSIRDTFTNHVGVNGGSWFASAQKHQTWYDHGPGMGFWSDVAPAGGEWVTETFFITTKTLAEYEAAGYAPTFSYYIGVNHTKNKVDVKNIVITELSINDDLQSGTIADKEVGYVKILDEVEDNATYKVKFSGNQKQDGSWSSVYALTANADNVYLNQSLIYGYNPDHGVYGTMGSFGYKWTQTFTTFITTDLAAQEGNALYLYVTNTAMLAHLDLISVEKVEGLGSDGAAILEDQPADAKQAIRYFYTYNTVNGDDIVIDGETYKIASRGFLLANSANIGDAVVTRTTAYNNSSIIDVNTTDFTKCWEATDNGDGTTKIVFSTYVKGFKPTEGTYNNTERLYVKGYVVLENGSVLYGEEITATVADIASELGLVG